MHLLSELEQNPKMLAFFFMPMLPSQCRNIIVFPSKDELDVHVKFTMQGLTQAPDQLVRQACKRD